MSASDSANSTRDERVNQIIADYLRSLEIGQVPDRAALLARHADLAGELASFFADQECFDRAAAPLAQALTLPPPTAGRHEPPAAGVEVRYFGDYELLEEIARGGMGVVYKARQSTLKRIVALKMILSGQLAGADEVRRFYVEAEAAARLDHPNIVPIFEIGQHDGQHYFSMAFVDGESLAHKIVAGPMPPRRAVELMKKVGDAVAYAHIEGVVHRDLKPANVLIDQVGNPHVTDFGLAKRISAEDPAKPGDETAARLTTTGQVLGTPSYMPPEQAGGESKRIGPLSDVYSLGAILYCLLTGRPPFQAASTMETLLQVLQQEPVSPRLLNPKVPRDLETICLKCLAKESQKRYSSAAAFAEDLRRFLKNEPIVARPITSWERGVKWAKRRPAIAAMTAAILLVAVLGVSGIAWQWRKAVSAGREAALKAIAEAEAKEQAQDALTASLYEQARAVRLIGPAGRRWRDLELLKEAERLRSRERPVRSNFPAAKEPSTVSHEVPSRSQLRSEAVAALLLSDAHLVRQTGGVCHSVNPEGTLAATFWFDIEQRERGNAGLVITDLKSGKEVSKWEGEDARPLVGVALALGPKGNRLAAVSAPTRRTRSGINVVKLPERKRLLELSLPDQRGGASPTKTRNARLAPFEFLASGDLIVSLRFSPNGRYLSGVTLSTTGNRLVVWDLDGDAAGHDAGGGLVKGLPGVAFSPDSRLLAYVSKDGKIVLWNVAQNHLDQKIKLPLEPGGALSFAPDGTLGVACTEPGEKPSDRHQAAQTLLIWDVARNHEIKRIAVPSAPNGISFSPDGTRVAVSSVATGSILVLDLAGKKPAIALSHQATPLLLAWTDDSRHLLSGDAGSLKTWEFADESSICDLRMEFESATPFDGPLAFSPNGRFLAVESRGLPQVDLYDSVTRKLVRHFGFDAPDKFSGFRLLFSPDGRQLVRVSLQSAVVWDVESGAQRSQISGNASQAKMFTSAGFRGDGTLLLGELDQFEPAVLEAGSGKVIWRGAKNSGMTAVVSPDGRFATAFGSAFIGKLQTLPLVDLSTGRERHQLPGAVKKTMGTLCEFSADGRWLLALHLQGAGAPGTRAVLSSFGPALLGSAMAEQPWTADVWDVESGERHMEIGGTSNPITYTFSRNGRYLAVGMVNGAIRIWDIQVGEELFDWHPLGDHSEASATPNHLAFTPDNASLAIANPGSPSFQVLNLTRLNDQLSKTALNW